MFGAPLFKTWPKSKRGFRQLAPEEIVSTSEALSERIKHRFPSSDLYQISLDLIQLATEAQARAIWLATPILSLRIAIGLVVTLCAGLFALYLQSLKLRSGAFTLPELLQTMEACTSEAILLGAGIIFLIGIEVRVKRWRGLSALHELRSMAHIVDMHQLTKDPARLDQRSAIWTPVSPKVDLDAFHLSRYLDYCSEMLSLIGKIGTVYSERLADPVLLAAVDDVEGLTTALSNKIWQKIMIIRQEEKN